MDDVDVPEVTTEKLADGSLWIRGPRGAAILVNARTSNVVRLQFGGHLLGKMMALALAALDEGAAWRGEEFAIVIDAESQSGYEPEVRALATAWLLKHKGKLRPAHLLGRAPMVKMGAQMFNLALGSEVFKIHEDRREFDLTVGKVIRDSERMRAASRS
jgi:hypothetical protein